MTYSHKMVDDYIILGADFNMPDDRGKTPQEIYE